MYNWSIDKKNIEKDREKHAIWKIEQMVNFGLDKGKIKEKELRKYFKKINIDPHRLKFLKLLLKIK